MANDEFSGQLRHWCGAHDGHNALLDTSEEYRRNRDEIRQFAEEYVEGRRQGTQSKRSEVVKIPVVVHVVHNTAEQNIPRRQIRSQIKVLNDDFSARNEDLDEVPEEFEEVIGDAQIRFRLAKQDPDGNPTRGVTRTETNIVEFAYNYKGTTGSERNPVKFASEGGVNAWPSDEYLNMWVCPLDDGLLGYASFPGGPAKEDGVVINYQAFGTRGTATAPFNGGRTATHEVGHWLNLRHIWGDDRDGCDGTDHVNDTPNQAGPNYGRPTHPHLSCENEGDMFMNYMDYVDDESMYMFSAGQTRRIDATLRRPRVSILESNALTSPERPAM